ncbi:hypothetical protein OF83DRAFT_1173867 [Amylostereum chailletii]|nr:hypothetical protein OF83DRAFT_1173867 [Amylostereum chailletii]
MTHKARSLMQADPLSRLNQHVVSDSEDNRGVMMLKPEMGTGLSLISTDFTVPVGGGTRMPKLDQRLRKLRKACEDAEAAMQLDKENMKNSRAPGRTRPHKFKVGDKVMLASKNISIH